MKKNLLIIAAIASATLVSCSSDEFGGEENYPIPVQDAPIAFGSYFKAMTRADVEGAEAAALLGNTFVVSGYKGDQTLFVKDEPTSDTEPAKSNIVFDNYKVVWQENTANTTESNSENWEYVGVTPIQHATDAGITAQKIKYWDYSQKQYDFIAWSTGKKTAIYTGTPAAGEVLVSTITPATATGVPAANEDAKVAYTFTGSAADLQDCYIADLVTVKKGDKYGKPVTLKFRQLGTKVRIALYETVPGYSVKNVQFYSAAASDDANAATAKLFTTTENDIFTNGTYTVYFPTVDSPNDADNNQAHVSFVGTGDQSTIINWNAVNYTIAEDGEKSTDAIYLGRTSNTASFAGDPEKNYYKIFLPNQTGTNLNLRVNYTLESTDGSGEVINVKGATAQVPSIYTQWKPGYAYTYLFKISDKTNGHTGVYDPTKPDDTSVNSDPVGLYPITFDAVVVNAEEDATQETITLVSTPSITTYQKGSNVVNNNEYEAATGNIFVTVNDGEISYEVVTTPADGQPLAGLYTESGGVYTPCGANDVSDGTGTYYRMKPIVENGTLATLTGKAALYTLSEDKTEAEVIDALSMQDDGAAANTIKGRNGLVLTEAEFTLTNSVEYGADGNAISVGTDQALRFTPAAGTYAFVYEKTPATKTKKIYQPVSVDAGDLVAGLYRGGLQYADAGDVEKGVVYFTSSTSGKVTVFLGQTVSNLYLDDHGTIASGYAKTGTTYYYTTDGGQSYKAAKPVAYADFESTTLYTDAACTTEKQETTPTDGQAYYYKDASTGDISYCVIYPQRTETAGARLMVYKPGTYWECKNTETAIDGMLYYDMYEKNDGVRYAKVIKVQ